MALIESQCGVLKSAGPLSVFKFHGSVPVMLLPPASPPCWPCVVSRVLLKVYATWNWRLRVIWFWKRACNALYQESPPVTLHSQNPRFGLTRHPGRPGLVIQEAAVGSVVG